MADTTAQAPRSCLARPKINLFLHVTGRRADGYHLLDSLVVFAETGDSVTAEPTSMLSLSIDGPFGDTLEVSENNLVLKAAMALERVAQQQGKPLPGAALLLTKRLPVASGIGGGSADAASTLTLLNDLWSLGLSSENLEQAGVAIGADVPVCIASTSRMMRGIGDVLSPAPAMPTFWLLLVNPMRGVETRAVFSARDPDAFSEAVAMPDAFATAADLAAWLSQETRNDLAEPARRLMPEIAEIEAALAALPGALMARMSGSGATCFAVFAAREEALAASRLLAADHPDWWIEPAPVFP